VGQKDLPVAGGEAHAKAFGRDGWKQRAKTQGKNPHIILTKPGVPATLSIPNHKGKTVSRVIIQKQIQLAGLTEKRYIELFNQ
jgi:hypothetical protein